MASVTEIGFLQGRLNELENAANSLKFMIDNKESKYFDDAFMRQNLVKVLTESAAVRRKLAELRSE